MSESIYHEDNIHEFGVVHNWHNATIKDSIITSRGTKVEIIERQKWGLACYMDNSIQSALIDEKIYHESLVHPIMLSATYRKRVLIIGGGEGATAREVLKWPDVEQVDMYEWDPDVVELFKSKYPQWAKGAWNDSRLNLHYVDIFESIKSPPSRDNIYDVVIIDLFEPDENNTKQWLTLIKSLPNWISTTASVVMYAGMRNMLEIEQPYKKLSRFIQEYNLTKQIIAYRTWIPSFSGESVFLLFRYNNFVEKVNFEEIKNLKSHITDEIWNSYKTLNW
jgi:spermidine synthase